MLHLRGHFRVSVYALAMLAAVISTSRSELRADELVELQPTPALAPPASEQQPPEPSADGKANDTWAPMPEGQTTDTTTEDVDGVVRLDQSVVPGGLMSEGNGEEWYWQWVPAGLIYHSYMAGVHEPRAGITTFWDGDNGAYGDATLGGRMGFIKFGNIDPIHSAGLQLDFYGAAIARLNLKEQQDLDSTDYVFGLPLTYGNEVWQFKLGYAHISSHLGDEYIVTHPGFDRVNYVRDSIVFGTSYYPVPAWRVYGEVGWAFHPDGGAGPWDSQFGTELSKPGPTGNKSVPFMAVNARVRKDLDVVGDVNFQAGWLRRGILGQTLRYGLDIYNGKSSQSQFFRESEQQYGIGLWYDF